MNIHLEAQKLRTICQQASSILLTGPIYPDGDSIGACLALARGLRHISNAQIDVAGQASFRYAWLPDAQHMIPDEKVACNYDLAIVLDGDRYRLHPTVDQAYQQSKKKGIIDHHSSTVVSGYDLAIVDVNAASTCEIAFQILEKWGIPLEQETAEQLYTGLIFDTAGFRHSNTKPSTHLLAAQLIDKQIDHSNIAARILMERQVSGIKLLGYALGKIEYLAEQRVSFCVISQQDLILLNCQPGDYEGIVEVMLFTCGVDLACLCIERQPGLIKVSLRSRCEVNVAKLAQTISPDGGGHRRAAGVILQSKLASFTPYIKDLLTTTRTKQEQ